MKALFLPSALLQAVTVTLRKNGEYVVLFENAAWANIMMTRWCPSGACLSRSITPDPI